MISSFNPVTALTIMIIVSIICLIGAAVLGFDKGVLLNMGRRDFARGLITYLFAVVTISIAAILVLSALTAAGDWAAMKDRFDAGKEVLSLLLGVFGTIIGYYFGSEASRRGESALSVSAVNLSPDGAKANETVTLRAAIIGGTAPYKYGIAIGNDPLRTNEPVLDNNWIIHDLVLRPLKDNEPPVLRLVVVDSVGGKAEQAKRLVIKD